MSATDIRWKQRFTNFNKALVQLNKFVAKGELNELEEQGLIKSFEYCYELSWNLIKDFYEEQGETGIQGSKDAFRLAFARGLVADGQVWMDMVENRKLTVHTYQEDMATKTARLTRDRYFPAFIALRERFEKLQNNQLSI